MQVTNSALDPVACATCGAVVTTAYCGACGEQRADARHYSLRHFVGEALETFVHADGRLVRTLRLLFTRPGELTRAYMRGERRPYVPPLQLFLIANVAYFLYAEAWGANTFGTPLAFHVQGVPYARTANRLVRARLAARHVTFDQYAARFNPTAMLQAKSLLVLMALLLGVATTIAILPRRAYVVKNMVFGIHIMTVLLALLVAIDPVMKAAAIVLHAVRGTSMTWQTADVVSSLLIAVAFAAYASSAFRRAYAMARVEASTRSIVLVFGLIASVLSYRAILFFITFAAT